MTALRNDIRTRLYLNDDWRDISGDPRYDQGVVIRRGYGPEDEFASPATCKFTLDNRSGDYTEHNPLGQWYGYLGRSTPVELACRLVKDTASSTVSNGWGSSEAHADGAYPAYVWSTSGGVAGDYAKASGKATHTIGAANSSRTCYLDSFSQREVDVTFTVQISANNITGGTISVDTLLRAQSSLATYYVARLQIDTSEVLYTDFLTQAGTSLGGGALDVPGITHSSAQTLRVRVQAEARTLRIKVWVASSAEPYDWTDSFTDEGDAAATATMIDAAGRVGIRSVVGSGNTNVPVTFSYDDIEILSPEFSGEIPSWPRSRDTTGNDRTIAVTAADVTRRLDAGDSPLNSALRREILDTRVNDWNVYSYWALEENEHAVPGQLIATGGIGSLGFEPSTAGTTVGKVTWAAESTLLGGLQAPSVTGGGSLVALLSPSTATGAWSVTWCMKQVYADGSTVLVSTDNLHYQIHALRNANSLTMNLLLSVNGAASSTIASWTFADRNDVEEWHSFEIQCFGGADTAIFFIVDGEQAGLGHTEAAVLRGLRRIHMNTLTDVTGETAFAHLFVISSAVDSLPGLARFYDAFVGFSGERALTRAHRLCDEEGVEFDWLGAGVGGVTEHNTEPMGPQRPLKLLTLLRECAAMDGGLLYSQRSINGLQFRTLRTMYSRTPWVELSMSAGHFSPPWSATADDRALRNDILAQRPGGGDYRYKLDDGSRMSVSSPADGGAGAYSSSVSVNVESDTQLPDQATWRVHQGTVDEDRFPALRLELHRSVYRDTPGLALSAKLRDLDIGELINLTGMESEDLYDDLEQIVVGIDKRIDQLTYDMALVCRPASRYRVAVFDDSTYGLIDSGSSTLASGINTSATSLSVATSDAGDLWTTAGGDFPFDITIGGERMTVTNITGSSSPQTFTVTRNVNSLPGGKSHLAGASVSVANPNYIGI
jgi:hypothetical protein